MDVGNIDVNVKVGVIVCSMFKLEGPLLKYVTYQVIE